MRIMSRIILWLALFFIGVGIVLCGVSLLTGGGPESIVSRGVVPERIDALIGQAEALFSWFRSLFIR